LQLATLTGHTFRVLYLAISPDGQVVGLPFFMTVLSLLTINLAVMPTILFINVSFPGWNNYYLFQTIVTGAGDETLRFWSVFPSPKSQVIVSLNDDNN
jgi:cell division cycle 20-like protein 1 (cofactor of APC complex)